MPSPGLPRQAIEGDVTSRDDGRSPRLSLHILSHRGPCNSRPFAPRGFGPIDRRNSRLFRVIPSPARRAPPALDDPKPYRTSGDNAALVIREGDVPDAVSAAVLGHDRRTALHRIVAGIAMRPFERHGGTRCDLDRDRVRARWRAQGRPRAPTRPLDGTGRRRVRFRGLAMCFAELDFRTRFLGVTRRDSEPRAASTKPSTRPSASPRCLRKSPVAKTRPSRTSRPGRTRQRLASTQVAVRGGADS